MSASIAFALSEPEAGSDVAAMACAARLEGDHYVLDGEKTWISNGGIADVYVVFVRTGEAPGSRGISAFMVDARTPGLDASERGSRRLCSSSNGPCRLDWMRAVPMALPLALSRHSSTRVPGW